MAFVEGVNVHLWDLETNSELAILDHIGAIHVDFSSNGELLASGSGDGTIQILDMQTLSIAATLDSGFDNAVHDLQFSDDGEQILAGNREGIYVWEVRDALLMGAGQKSHPQDIWESQSIWSLAFSPDGSLLATGIWDAFGDRPTVDLWDITTHSQITHLRGNSQNTRAVAFNPNGDLLTSAGDDNAVRLWDVTTGEELTTLEGHTNWVSSVAFSPDGKLLASAGYDGNVFFWGVPAISDQ